MSIYTEIHKNLYRDVCEMEAMIALTFLHSACLRQGRVTMSSPIFPV